MNLRVWNYSRFATLILLSGRLVATADEPPRLPGAPIIFSQPKSDSVSSNLNQIDSKASPFKGLESDLKKPFQIFDAGRSDGSFRPGGGLTDPPAAPMNNRRIKELMDKRAELLLLDPDHGDGGLDGEDPRKADEDPLEAAGKKLKTPLDRYYNQLDRERMGTTNQMSEDLFGKKNDSDAKETLELSFSEGPFDGDRRAAARALAHMSNNASSVGFFSESPKPRVFYDLADEAYPKSPAERSAIVKEETRLDDYKRLLGGSSYAPRNSDYSPGLPVIGAAQRPVTPSPAPAWSLPAAPVSPRDSFTSRAGLVGAPPALQSVPSFSATTPSLNPTFPSVVQPKPPVSTFSIPKRQF